MRFVELLCAGWLLIGALTVPVMFWIYERASKKLDDKSSTTDQDLTERSYASQPKSIPRM